MGKNIKFFWKDCVLFQNTKIRVESTERWRCQGHVNKFQVRERKNAQENRWSNDITFGWLDTAVHNWVGTSWSLRRLRTAFPLLILFWLLSVSSIWCVSFWKKRENFDRVVRWRYLENQIITIFKSCWACRRILFCWCFFILLFFLLFLWELVNGEAVEWLHDGRVSLRKRKGVLETGRMGLGGWKWRERRNHVGTYIYKREGV